MQKDYSVLRWPCPEWFHVPLSSEWVTLRTILTSTFSMAQNKITAGTYLKMPTAGYRVNNTADVHNVGYRGDYWSATPHSDSAYILTFDNNGITPQNMGDRSDWHSIRWFKDTPVIPTSSWTTLYDWSSIATNAWVFHNATDWLISISGDWQTWYTIQDKNLWATSVYNYWDTLTDANCWYFYQRGNNYWFPHSWNVTRSTIKPDTSTYWPGNYYISNNFIKITSTASSQSDWSSVKNNNLWWYESFLSQDNDIYICWWPNNYVAMQWPCEDWWHIPSIDEIKELQSLNSLWINLSTALHMPLAWYYDYSHWMVNEWQKWYYQTSYTEISNGNWFNCSTSIIDSSISYTYSWWRPSTNAASIRPFKNEPAIPDNTWTTIYDWSSIASWAWIFRDQTNGYISISMDWINRKTISDKNIWATQVWNYWDSLTDNNTWKFFQRWNCYWFNRWHPSKYDDKYVDTEWYWPWNFYYSDTFKINMRDWMKTSDWWWADLWWYYSFYKNLEITVWDWYDYQLLRWPCPEWYHVPSSSERWWIGEIMNIFDYNNVIGRKTYLHMPIAWYIQYNNWNKAKEWDYWEFWSSTPSTNDRATLISLGAINWDHSTPRVSGLYRTTWLNIRPFKDIPEMPDDSWTVVETQWNAGIYTNQTLWLITITDWIRQYTMCDKNLWATVVYNPWDTLTQNNCWWFFQRWNNYMFPFAWPTTKSTTRVDTTWYWPWNYYSSDTFIYSRADWSKPTNDNLRGAVNSQTPNVAEVYVWDTLVWTNYQPITPTAWVYWCPTKKCISISANWTNWITMSDRNIWAAKPWDVWLLYQRWNNYWFPPQRLTTVSTDSTQIDVSSYWPNNYYYSDTYITNNLWRSNWDVRDLRWWVTLTDESVRWPCWEWWHIPSRWDLQYLINWSKQIISDHDTIRNVLKLWEWRYRDNAWKSKCCYYAVRCCEATYYSSSQKTYPYFLRAPWEHASPVIDISQSMTNYAHPIRPFKNEPVVPNDTSRIKLA